MLILLLHPEIVPSSVAKINPAGPLEVPFEMTNPVVELLTWPVGAGVKFGGGLFGGAIGTGEGGEASTPVPRYNDANPVPLSEIQIGLAAELDIPQGLTRFSSCTAATPGRSETKFC